VVHGGLGFSGESKARQRPRENPTLWTMVRRTKTATANSPLLIQQ
jgi:hypothetical protein